jgi:hypothetical protein
MMTYWGNRIREHPAVSDFLFASIEDPAFSHLPSAVVFPHYAKLLLHLRYFTPDNPAVRLLIKDIFAMEYCVRNTIADWCFRLMDDLYINEAAFSDFLGWLTARQNPRSTAYVIGNCVMNPSIGFYLQGGSGYALSRFAAQRLVDVYEEWLINVDTLEDFYITSFIKSLGIQSQDCDCPYFSGHFLNHFQWRHWQWRRKSIRKCPETIRKERFCAHRLVPVKKLVFIHSLKHFMSHEYWAKWMENVPDDVMIHYVDSGISFCFGSPEQIAAWDTPY